MTSKKAVTAIGVLMGVIAGLSLASPSWAQPAHDEPTWFAIMGNLIEDDADTVELNVADARAPGLTKNMDLRVNLAHQRTLGSGEKYTSYKSIITIDCETGGVFHIEQTRYVGPRWTGESSTQQFGTTRPMAFGGLIPSPKARVLKAACAK